ncbi:MAG: hypothetical protein ACLGIG_04295 [Actinomycetes bacterium]
MTRPIRSHRAVAGVLSTYSGAERALVEQALQDERLARRPRLRRRRGRGSSD